MLSRIESQPTLVIALSFSAAYLSAALIFCLAAFFSRHPVAKALQLVTPGILSPLGTILGILSAFLAVRVWTKRKRGRSAISTRKSAPSADRRTRQQSERCRRSSFHRLPPRLTPISTTYKVVLQRYRQTEVSGGTAPSAFVGRQVRARYLRVPPAVVGT
jgi:hypothetical protein